MTGDPDLLSIHHIGARDGSRGFPALGAFESEIVNVLYEADTTSVAQIRERNRNLGSQLHVLPFCVGRSGGTAFLNINFDPYTSSLLATNPEYAGFYSEEKGHDYLWGDASRTVRRPKLDVVTLDSVIDGRAGGPPPPDFLSIDTQGSEFDIISGATATLRNHVLALIVEVEFHRIYKDQKLFGDVCGALSERGFHFVCVDDPFVMAPHRGPVGFRGRGFQVSGNALFLRRIDSVNGLDIGADSRRLMLQKLAFFSVIFGQVEYALQCLSAPTGEGGEAGRAISGKRKYQDFLRKLFALSRETPGELPPTFAERHTFETSSARFAESGPDGGAASGAKPVEKPLSLAGRCKGFLRSRFPLAHSIASVVKQRYAETRSRGGAGGDAGGHASGTSPASKVERLFAEYGFASQARLLEQRRGNIQGPPDGHQAPS